MVAILSILNRKIALLNTVNLLHNMHKIALRNSDFGSERLLIHLEVDTVTFNTFGIYS